MAAVVLVVSGLAAYYLVSPAPSQAVSTTILISEVEPSAVSGGAAGEWFELVNVSNAPITLTNWTVTDNGGALDIIPTITINPGQYVVIAAEVSNFLTDHPGFVGAVELPSASIGSNGLADGGDRLELRDNSAVLIDAMSFGSDATYFTLPAPSTGTNITFQRTTTFDTDTNNDWTAAAETPGAPSSTVLYHGNSSSAGDFDAAGDTGYIAGKTLSWSHTVGTGSNRALVVGVSTAAIDAALPGNRVTSVTYGGTPLTRIPLASAQNAGNQVSTEMFILVNPPSGTANIDVALVPLVNYVVGGASSFIGVHQTTPMGTATSATGSGTTASTTVTTTTGDVVIDTVTTLPNAFIAVGAGQTQRWDGQGFFSNSFDVAGGSTEPAANSTSVTMSWTIGASQTWVTAAVPLKPAAVTLVRLADFTATQTDAGVALNWQTGYEVDNLGFNIYREQKGRRTRVNSSLIAGTALMAGQGTRLTAGESYRWLDRAGKKNESAQYWLEDVDLNGKRTMHGPIVPVAGDNIKSLGDEQELLLSQLNDLPRDAAAQTIGYPVGLKIPSAENARSEEQSSPVSIAPQRRLASKLLRIDERLLEAAQATQAEERVSIATDNSLAQQRAIARGQAVKIGVRQSGWYRVTQAELVAAGLNPNTNPGLIQLYADGVEQSILLNGNKNQLTPDSSIEFYGTGMDTTTSDTRTYWLVIGSQPGRRINAPNSTNPNSTETVYEIDTTNTQPQRPNINPIPTSKPGMTNVPSSTVRPNAPWFVLILPDDNSKAPSAPSSPSSPSAEAPKARKKSTKKKANRKALRQLHHGSLRSKVALDVQEEPSSKGFPYTWERKDSFNYISALLNGDADNFFGSLVMNTPVNQDLNINGIDRSMSGPATVEVALQGVTAQPHQVRVSFNGVELGVVSFDKLENHVAQFAVPRTALVEGTNRVTLASLSGESDISLVDYTRVTYWHAYAAENETLTFTSNHTKPIQVDGFTTSQIRVFDVADQSAIEQVSMKAMKQGAGFAAKIAGGRGTTRTLLAITEGQIRHPASVTANEPSNLSSTDNRADFVILTHRDFRDAVKPLADLRRSQGLETIAVDVADVYDEFSYGAHSRDAIREFLGWAKNNWALAPRYVLFVGDASIDPRNYLGFGEQDFVPTRLIDTTYLETASDDSLCDFDGNGVADLAVGRLPVRTVADAQELIGKITNYAPGQTTYGALLVSDRKDGHDFEAATDKVRSFLPSNLSITTVNRRDNPPEQVRGEIINGINAGPLLVNFAGHGSSDVWTGAGILRTSDAGSLANNNRLPLFVLMTCLNGRYQDPFRETLTEALMKADNGGAIAVWSSSGLTLPDPQGAMNQELMRLLFAAGPAPALGDAVRGAKAATTDPDVRRTWILFGDPTMKLR